MAGLVMPWILSRRTFLSLFLLYHVLTLYRVNCLYFRLFTQISLELRQKPMRHVASSWTWKHRNRPNLFRFMFNSQACCFYQCSRHPLSFLKYILNTNVGVNHKLTYAYLNAWFFCFNSIFWLYYVLILFSQNFNSIQFVNWNRLFHLSGLKKQMLNFLEQKLN